MIILQQTRGSLSAGADMLALDLPFAETKSLVARVGPTPVFTRASSATYVDSDRIVKDASIDAPRFQHNPTTGVCLGYLSEGTRTNLTVKSHALVNGVGWGGNVTGIIVSDLSPYNLNASRLSESAITGIQSFGNNGTVGAGTAVPVSSGVTYTASLFLKKIAGNIDWVQLTIGSAGFGTAQYANFNLSNGTIGASANGVARIEAFADGWYRCSWAATATASVTNSVGVIVGFIQNTNQSVRLPSYAGSTANRVLAAMGQLEAGAAPSSYIHTDTSFVIRSPDVCTISGTDFSSMYNPVAGSLYSSTYANESTISANAQIVVDINDGTGNNRIRYSRGTASFSNLIITTNGSVVANLSGGSMPTATRRKLGVAFSQNDFAFFQEGSLVAVDTSGDMISSPTVMTIGDSSAGVGRLPLNGVIEHLRYYRRRNTNPKLQAITA